MDFKVIFSTNIFEISEFIIHNKQRPIYLRSCQTSMMKHFPRKSLQLIMGHYFRKKLHLTES